VVHWFGFDNLELSGLEELSGLGTAVFVLRPVFHYFVMNRDFSISSSPLRRRTGFTLTELLISVILISIMAVTIGVAMFRTQERSHQTRTTLVRLQNQSHILDSLSEELRWAHTINSLDAASVNFMVSDDGENVTIEYDWDDVNHLLKRSVNGEPSTAVLEDVYLFDLQQGDFGWDNQNQRYLRSIKISLQTSPDVADTCEQLVHLINNPYW